MNVELGHLTALLSEPENNRIRELVELINLNINPPAPLKEDEVIIRAMFIVSDEINNYGGKFPPEELERLVTLLVDSPVLIGHRKDKLPVGRNFHAELIERDGKSWVKSYFYWLRSADGADDLKENIDGGIYKECSIGFTFSYPECSVCQKDIRSCQHEPFQQYPQNGENQICFFLYRQVEKVLETSLVYRGAVPDTSVTKDLHITGGNIQYPKNSITEIDSLTELPESELFLVTPRYESINLIASGENCNIELRDESGHLINQEITNIIFKNMKTEIGYLYGQLVGYRGKERCSKEQLQKYLDNQSGPVTRVELKLIPTADDNQNSYIDSCSSKALKVIPHGRVAINEIPDAIKKLATKEGVNIWPASNKPFEFSGYYFKPDDKTVTPKNSYHLINQADPESGHLIINTDDNKNEYKIHRFDLNRFLKGSRFIADEISNSNDRGKINRGKLSGNLITVQKSCDGMVYQFDGEISGRIIIQRAKLKGKMRFIIYRLISM